MVLYPYTDAIPLYLCYQIVISTFVAIVIWGRYCNFYVCRYESWLYRKLSKIANEYDQEIPQSQTADKPMAKRRTVTESHNGSNNQSNQSNN